MNIVSVVVETIAACQLKLYYQNYLESGTVTVTSESSLFPKYRLYDRAQGLLFKGTSFGAWPGLDLLTNGGMEVGNPPTDWYGYNSPGTFERSAVQKHGGSYSTHIIADADGKGFHQLFQTYAGKRYKVGFWYYLVSGQMQGWFSKGDATGIAFETGALTTIGSWQYCEFSGVQTASGAIGGVHFLSKGGAAEFYVDDGSAKETIFEIKDDLGASGPYPLIDTLILGKNHNLTGLALALSFSDNDVDYTPAASWTATSGINRQSFTGAQHRFWKLSIASPASYPESGEVFLTKGLLFDRNPNLGYGFGRVKGINRLESKAAYSQKTKWAEMRKRRRYHLTRMESSQRVDIETFEDVTESIKNFYVEDLQGNLFFAELPEPLPDFIAEQGGRWGLDFTVQEVLD